MPRSHNITSMQNSSSGFVGKGKIALIIVALCVACVWTNNHSKPIAPPTAKPHPPVHCRADQWKASVPTDPTESADLSRLYAMSPVVSKVTLGKIARLNGLKPTSSISGNSSGQVCIFFTGKGISAADTSKRTPGS